MQAQFKNNFAVFLLIMLVVLRPSAFAADTAIASFDLVSNVPTIFSVTAVGQPGDLDLSPNVIVNNRLIGLLHFKYNANIASLTISSSTPSGGPEGASGAYNFQGGFKVAVAAPCVSVDPAFNTPFTLTNIGTDIKSVASTALVSGVEENCSVTASFKGTNVALPLAGVYTLSVKVTMISM